MFEKKDDGTYAFSHRFWVAVLIGALLICAIGWNTQRAYDRTEKLGQELKELTENTQECLSELIRVQTARADLNSRRDELSEHQRFEFLHLFQALLDPPANIVALPPSSAERQKWAEDTARKYINTIAADQVLVEDVKAQLKAHPIPDPDCTPHTPDK